MYSSLIVYIGVCIYIIGVSINLVLSYKKKPIYWLKEAVKFLFVVYMLLVVSVTLFPIYVYNIGSLEGLKYSVNIIPLVSILKSIEQIGTAYDGDALFMSSLIIRNVGGNILLFMPLGVLAPIIWRQYKNLSSMLFLGLLLSIFIEGIQFFEILSGSSIRAVDVDDVICNVFGAMIGYFIYAGTFKLANRLQITALQRLDTGNPMITEDTEKYR
ncbi:VanZ family protein [Niallia sp. NCCP-28]|uniref:VanZ family protein n=1 Tax=Niallia sp. NCCP-28 TaxID=2934712 RepID=UPI002083C35C|nr:VanZ family protein [Niallia sp. NCCP-28]GKU82645.1 VanZ family protein [Niallia sp. NCCP-28]